MRDFFEAVMGIITVVGSLIFAIVASIVMISGVMLALCSPFILIVWLIIQNLN